MTIKELEQKIIDEAFNNGGFARELVHDPKNAIRKFIERTSPDEAASFQLPENLNINLHFESPNTWHIVIPMTKEQILTYPPSK